MYHQNNFVCSQIIAEGLAAKDGRLQCGDIVRKVLWHAMAVVPWICVPYKCVLFVPVILGKSFHSQSSICMLKF